MTIALRPTARPSLLAWIIHRPRTTFAQKAALPDIEGHEMEEHILHASDLIRAAQGSFAGPNRLLL